MVFSLLLIVILSATAPGELAPLRVTDKEMRGYAELGRFPLMAAASAAQLHALAFVAGLQTFGAFALLAFVAVFFGWRGFASGRVRGWSNGYWVAGVMALCFFPSVFPGVTAQLFDYVITASISNPVASRALPGLAAAIYGPHGLNSHMLPAVFLAERALVVALLAAPFSVLCHDLAYRLREALEDFGVIEADEERDRQSERAGAGRRARRPRHETGDDAADRGGGFGQRGAPPSGAPQSADAHARAVLGVSESATRREIERAYRSQMKRAHPDHGGSVERAAALNAARDALLRRG